MTNSADPDQLASSEANWSGSTLIAKTGHVMLSKRKVKPVKTQSSLCSLIRVFPVSLNKWSLFSHTVPSKDSWFYSPVNPLGSCRAGSVNLPMLFLGRLSPVHILLSITDNCLSRLCERGRMALEIISWSISMKVMSASWVCRGMYTLLGKFSELCWFFLPHFNSLLFLSNFCTAQEIRQMSMSKLLVVFAKWS